ncbi:putative presenilin/signal peptide peptidase [Plasmopara halstedii]
MVLHLHVLFLAALLTSCTAINPADSILSGVLNVKNSKAVFYVSSSAQESWGESLEAQKLKDGAKHAYYPLVYNASGLSNSYGCRSQRDLLNTSGDIISSDYNLSSTDRQKLLGLPDEPFVLLVDRGQCTFTEKAYFAQELGAAILLVTDTLEQLYNRSSAVDATEDEKQMEFCCSRGSGKAIWNSDTIDFKSSAWKDNAGVRSCTSNSKCSSRMCVPSGGSDMQVCCAWDIPDPMEFSYSDIVTNKKSVSDIVVVRISIAGGESLKEMLSSESDNEDGQLLISVYKREPPVVDPAQVILLILACATVFIGSYKGAAYERTKAQLKAALQAADVTSSDAIAQAQVAYEEHDERAPKYKQLDLNFWYASLFVFLGSGLLVLLFFVNVMIVVVVFFGIGSVFATFRTIWEPLMRRLPGRFLRKLPWCDVLWHWGDLLVPAMWSIGDLLALFLSVLIALFWFLTRFQSFSWIFQDVLGVCFCLVFLRTARLVNLKVATVLLLLLFVYDLFIVFISPYIFKESVIIKEATGDAQSSSSGYCLRYPTNSDHDCRSEVMPILLRVPKVLDWRSGFTILSLGDIVVPGLLLVFCARYDYATREQLFGRLNHFDGNTLRERSLSILNGSSITTTTGNLDQDRIRAELGNTNLDQACRRGLFCLLMWGYVVGLIFANIAVVTTGYGQPASLYLVPCTLGLLIIVGWRRGILSKLWEGPPELIPGYICRKSFRNGKEFDIYEVTRLRGLSLEAGKAETNEILTSQQQENCTPVFGSYTSDDIIMDSRNQS